MCRLCGFPPFYSAHGLPMSPGMKTRIRTGQYAFPSPEWDRVSESAKGLIRGLLKTDPAERLQIDQVVQHVWITHYARVPETPLHTVALLNQEREQWGDMQVRAHTHTHTARPPYRMKWSKHLRPCE